MTVEFKVDESLHSDAATLLRSLGHDAVTVYEQRLRGGSDAEVADVCRRESRALVTLDLDFADIRAYPPTEYQGIIVLRLRDQSRQSALSVLERILPLLGTEPLAGRLWIADESQVRIREQ